jgi:predicted permease
MRAPRAWLLRFANIFSKQRRDGELTAEIESHLQMHIEDNLRAGMTPEEARRQAAIKLGGVEQTKENYRDRRGLPWLETLLQDIRFGLRMLRKNPGFTVVAVLTLALGIGANTAIFTLIDSVMLRPLPVEEPQQLIQIAHVVDGKDQPLSYPQFTRLNEQMHSIQGAFARQGTNAVLTIDGVEDQVTGEIASGEYFQVLQLKPAAGRLLSSQDDAAPGASPVAVISFDYWRRRFAEDPNVLGKSFSVGGQVFTIVGMTPESFTGVVRGEDPDVTFPLAMAEVLWGTGSLWRKEDDHYSLEVMARLRSDASVATANAELQVLFQGLVRDQASRTNDPDDLKRVLSQRAEVVSAPTGINQLRSQYAAPLLILMGAVTLVLLQACANVASLLLARSAERQREISVRRALGASRARLLRQFLTESAILALLGGAGGLLLAQWFSRGLVNMMANGGPMTLSVRPNATVLAFTVVVSLMTCLLAGIAPGFYASRSDVNSALKEVRIGAHGRWGKLLVVAQLALSMVLLVGASLFIGTVRKLYGLDSGFRRDGVFTFGLRASDNYAPGRAVGMEQTMVARLGDLPGVTSASAVQILPVSGEFWNRPVQVEGYSFGPNDDNTAAYNVVAPRYFDTIGTPLVGGRDFNATDTDNSPKTAIVNESFVRHFFGHRSALGYHVTYVNVVTEIVGVVKDAKYQDLRAAVVPTMYVPWTQRIGSRQPTMYTYVVHTKAGNPLVLTATADQLVRDVDPGLRMIHPQTFAEVVDHSIIRERIMAVLGGFFGLLALLVAGLGIFGVMAFQVSRRTNEFGVRMALGATHSNIIALMLREVIVMFLTGTGIGCVLALGLTHLSRNLLFGLNPSDPPTFVFAAATLGIAALAAGYIPARRAVRVDPMVALRHE